MNTMLFAPICKVKSLQLSVFDENDNFVAQRLSFIHPKSLYIDQPEFVSKKIDIKPRSYSSFDILPSDNYSHYTVIVRDKTSQIHLNMGWHWVNNGYQI